MIHLTLADADGRELDMGTRMNATPEESAGACYTQADDISREARSRRDILGHRAHRCRPGQLPNGVVALVIWRPLLGLANRSEVMRSCGKGDAW